MNCPQGLQTLSGNQSKYLRLSQYIFRLIPLQVFIAQYGNTDTINT